MSATHEPMADTTDREVTATFEDWNFATGMPDGDVLQRMCQRAAADAVTSLVKDMWLHLTFSDDRDAKCQNRLEFAVHAWDGEVTLGRPFAEIMAELADGHSYSDGEIDDDNEEVLEAIRQLEAAVALLKGRMRPRGTKT